ncbi:unnamed protein product [Moneuplotes crassus]|uniref:Uncharacterized protein n=1 Tax=Euplotes crassus TaxID=5936 RepID=A0AAD1X4Y2_EUPCR|nr:unnamed protein product [Moneuplotes crassus]
MAENISSNSGTQYSKLNDLVIPQKDPILLQKILQKNGSEAPQKDQVAKIGQNLPQNLQKVRIVDLCTEDKNKIGELFKKVTDLKLSCDTIEKRNKDLEDQLQTKNQEYEQLLNKFQESVEVIKNLKEKDAQKEQQLADLTREKENIAENIQKQMANQQVPQKETQNTQETGSATIDKTFMEQFSKFNKTIEELSMNFSMMKKRDESPELIKIPRKTQKKGLKGMIKYADSDHNSETDQSPERRLGSETEEECCLKKSKRVKRKTSKTRKNEFKAKDKILKNQKKKKNRNNSSDSNQETSKFASRQTERNPQNFNNEFELSNSRMRYNKVAEKAMDEMGQITSEDEDLMIHKKRQHIISSAKKEEPNKSRRLQNMLKNAALNSEDSIDQTPSSQEMEEVVPESHPFSYKIPTQDNMYGQCSQNYAQNYSQSYSQNYPQSFPQNTFNFQPEATFSPHNDQNYSGHPQLGQSYQNFPASQPEMGYNQYSNMYSYGSQPGMGVQPGAPSMVGQSSYMHREVEPLKFSNESPIRSKNKFGESKNARRDLYDDTLFDQIYEMESQDSMHK